MASEQSVSQGEFEWQATGKYECLLFTYLLSFNTHGNLFLLCDLGPRFDFSKGLEEEELCKIKIK